MNMPPLPSSTSVADQFALRLTARLSEGAQELPYDITERLRAARAQALSQRKKPVLVHQTAPAVTQLGSSAALGWGSEGGNWWRSLISAASMAALLAGLVVTQFSQDEYSTLEVAEVDAALLTDDLPPEAYADPGFAQFLKTGATQGR